MMNLKTNILKDLMLKRFAKNRRSKSNHNAGQRYAGNRRLFKANYNNGTKYHLTEENIEERFADTRDTLCYATYENQSAVYGLLKTDADLAIVVGGYNSSNTSHLVELCEEKLPYIFY